MLDVITSVGSVELALGLVPMTTKVDAECRPVKGVCRGTFTAVCHPSTATRRQSPVVAKKRDRVKDGREKDG